MDSILRDRGSPGAEVAHQEVNGVDDTRKNKVQKERKNEYKDYKPKRRGEFTVEKVTRELDA